MNRRSFFKSLAAAVAGTVVLPPAITFDRCWKYPNYKKAGSGIWIVNQEWLDAPYEIEFLLAQGLTWRANQPVHPILRKRPDWNILSESTPGFTKINEPFPIRYKNEEDIANGKIVHPWIELEK